MPVQAVARLEPAREEAILPARHRLGPIAHLDGESPPHASRCGR
jgi:hypothetical protein